MTKPRAPLDLAELTAAYHRHDATRAPDASSAFDRVGDIVRAPDAEQAWELVTALVHSASDDRLGYVAAGPLEELVRRHGTALIDWIEGEAKRDPRFREALSRIWLAVADVPQSIVARLQTATGNRIQIAERSIDSPHD